MLLEIKVSNFAIIDNLHLPFKKGLNIMSGETGAGKSVLLKSLSLLMGLKSSSESIRTGCAQASIEGIFDLSARSDVENKLKELGLPTEDHTLIIRRVITEEKSRVFINGASSTLNTLKDLVSPLIEVAGTHAPLIEMTGQFDNRNLLSKNYHLDLLDQFAKLLELRQIYQTVYEEWKICETKISTFQNDIQQKSQRLDFLCFQKEEIENFHLDLIYDSQIESEIKEFKKSRRWIQYFEEIDETFNNGENPVLRQLHSSVQKGLELSLQEPSLKEQMEKLKQASALIQDFIYETSMIQKTKSFDPEKLEEMESRLSQLRKLQKKYGPSLDDIINYLQKINEEISLFQNFEEHLKILQIKSDSLKKDLIKKAQKLHEERVQASKNLEKRVNDELLDLNMKGVTFHIHCAQIEVQKGNSHLTVTGLTDLEFMSRVSPKDPQRPLSKFASGGELSRILLSLKKVVGLTNQPRTYLFDEVDSGVSGPTADKVGRKLKSISTGQQVICVTHLPQVAAYGDAHYMIQKSPHTEDHPSVSMEVFELEKEQRVKEIARLISGEKISPSSIKHAHQLIQSISPKVP